MLGLSLIFLQTYLHRESNKTSFFSYPDNHNLIYKYVKDRLDKVDNKDYSFSGKDAL